MKKILLAATLALGIGSTTIGFSQGNIKASAKNYKTYIAPSFSTYPKGAFYTKKYKKTLPNCLIVENKADPGFYIYPELIIKNKGGQYLYHETLINSDFGSYFTYATDSNGYLNIVYTDVYTLNPNGNGRTEYLTFKLLSVSPKGVVHSYPIRSYKGSVKSLKFVTPNKLQFKEAYYNKNYIYKFKKGKVTTIKKK